MSIGQTIRLYPATIGKAKRLIEQAPYGSILNIRPATRTNVQNAKMHAMLSDIARAKPEGRTLTADEWKCLLMAYAGFKFKWEPGIDGDGVVPIGFKSSRLTKEEMSDLIEAIYEFGSRHNVEWSEPKQEAMVEEDDL